MTALADCHFLEPGWLLALLPLAALLAWLARPGGDLGVWRRVVDAPLLAALWVATGGRQRRRWLALLGLGWLLAVLALADPTCQREPVPAYRPAAARVVILDLSRSMLAADLTPNRLARARFKLADVLARADGAQTALVVFAGEAFVVAPLTDDTATITNLLGVLEPDLMPRQGSRVDRALQQAADLLRQAGARNGEVLLLADEAGDERARNAAVALRAAGHRLSVIGVGTPAGAPVPGVRRATGPVIAQLDEPALRGLAAVGGGDYARIAADGSDLAQVLRPPAMTGPRPDQDPQFAERWKPLGPWLTLALLPMAALAFRRGWLSAWLLPSLLLVPALGLFAPTPAAAFDWADLWQRREQRAAAALAQGDFARAEALTTDPQRRGAALYRQGDYQAAAAAFAGADDARAHYNRGNALARAGDLTGALAAYDQAIARQPDFEDARINRALVEEALRQQPAGATPPPVPEPQAPASEQASEQAAAGDPSTGSPDPGQGAQPPADQAAGQSEEGSTAAAQESDQPPPAAAAGSGRPAEDRRNAATDGGPTAGTAAPPDDNGTGQAQPPAGGQDQGTVSTGDPAREEQAAAAWREQAAGAVPAPAAPPVAGQPGAPADQEARIAAEQWLRRIPDDPGGLLRRKFLYQYQQRTNQGTDPDNPW